MRNHRIRLAGPWESQCVGVGEQSAGELTRCQLPFTLSESQCDSGVLLLRGFHCPTNVDDATTLCIVLQCSARPDAVCNNGTPIAECASLVEAEYAFELTGRLAAFNQLSVLFQSSQDKSPVTLNTAWLEIQG